MSQRQEPIAVPAQTGATSLFSQVVTPLNTTLLGLISLALSLVDHPIAAILFFVLRPFTILLAVIAVAAAVAAVVILSGSLAGLRLQFLALGPIQFHASGDAGWRIGINRSWRYFIGSSLLVPASGSFSRNQGVVAAGTGLVASLILVTSVVFYARSLGWPGIDEPGMSVQEQTLLLAAPLGAGIVFLAELLTGGTMLSSILRGSPEHVRRVLASMTVASRMALGQRPRLWEPELVEETLSLPDTTADHLIGLCFAYLAAVDRGELAVADHHLHTFERWLHESNNPNVRQYVISSLAGYASLYHEKAWLTAAYREDLDTASEYLNRAAEFNVATPIDLRVKAEILALEGDMDAAGFVARSALDTLDSFPPMQRWRVPFERDLLHGVLVRIEHG